MLVAHALRLRAVEEGLIQTNRAWQTGLRGSGHGADDFDWPRQQGILSCHRRQDKVLEMRYSDPPTPPTPPALDIPLWT